LDAISSRAPGYDEEENHRRWIRYKNEAFDKEKPITIATLFDLAKQHGRTGHVPVAPPLLAVHAPGPVGAPRAVSIASLPQTPKKREWLCGTYLMRGAITLLSAPGARGKTSWLITLAISCAAGKPLLGAHLFGGPMRVLYLSAEERTDEINLRLRAAMQHLGISEADLSGLQVIGAERWGMHLVGVNRGTPYQDENGWGALGAELDRIQPDILVADPLINLLGGADSNNNSVAGLVMGRFAREAATRNLAVLIAHHVAKGKDPLAAESALGAASFVNLSRIALSIDPLQEDKAGTVGLPPWEANSVFRVIGTKQNYSPVKSEDDWFRLVSVEVQNARPPIYPEGDKVGVVERFVPAASGAALFPETLLRSALQAIQDADPPLSPSARSTTRYAVPVIAKAIAPHRGGRVSETEAKAVMGHLIDVSLASVEQRKISRDGSRSDMRNGLFPTPSGAEFLRNVHASPQPPQTPATASAGHAVDASGDQPCGSPATQGGYGGKCGGENAGTEPVSHADPKPASQVKISGRSGTRPLKDITLSMGEPDGVS
jgi:AAA domain